MWNIGVLRLILLVPDVTGIQYSRAPKNVSRKNGQAGISRFFKNMPGWKFEL